MKDELPDPLLTSDEAPGPPPPRLRGVFLGSDGLRAGWSILLFLLVAIVLAQLSSMVARHFFPLPKLPRGAIRIATPGRLLIGETLGFAAMVFASWLMSLIERRPFGGYSLGGSRRIRNLFAGAAWGLLALSLLIGVLRVAQALIFDGVALHGQAALSFGAKWALVFLMVGLQEEFLTRGYIQFTLGRGLRGLARNLDPSGRRVEALAFWMAAVPLSSLLFMALHLHNKGETAIGILAVGVAGLTFAYSLWRTGSLWWAIGFHAAWDWAQSFLYGVPDSGGMVAGHLLASHPVGPAWLSGGTTGPEGSIFVLPTLLLVCGVIRWTLPAVPRPTVPRGTSVEQSLQ